MTRAALPRSATLSRSLLSTMGSKSLKAAEERDRGNIALSVGSEMCSMANHYSSEAPSCAGDTNLQAMPLIEYSWCTHSLSISAGGCLAACVCINGFACAYHCVRVTAAAQM